MDAVGSLPIDLDQVIAAARGIDPVFRATPQFTSQPLGELLGCRLILKVETVNPIGCFKGRGGDWVARTAGAGEVLACASAGNLGQGIAYGARSAGLEAHVYASSAASPLKLERIRRLGARLHLCDADFDVAKSAARDAADRHGWRLVEDGRDERLAEGAATMAVELTNRYATGIDHVFVPVGNGSLACGVASWFQAHSPGTRVVGVGSVAAPATQRAWQTGRLETGPEFTTIAEGLCARVPVAAAVRTLQASLDDFVLLEEGLFGRAVQVLWQRTGLVAEPSGAAGLAGALSQAADLAGSVVAVPVGGANLGFDQLAAFVAAPPEPEIGDVQAERRDPASGT